MPGTAQCHHMSTLIFSTTLKVMIASYWSELFEGKELASNRTVVYLNCLYNSPIYL